MKTRKPTKKNLGGRDRRGKKGKRSVSRTPVRKKTESIQDVRFRTLADNLLDVIMVFDRDFRHLYVNPYVEKQTGIPYHQFIGKTHRELGFPAGLCVMWEEAIQKVFDTGKVHRIEFQLPSQIWIDWLLMPEKDQKGNVQHVITAAREITARKHMEEELEQRVAERTLELQQSEEKYGSLFQESKDMVYISTPEGRFIDINPAGVSLLGFASKKEALSTNVRDSYLNPEDRDRFKALITDQGFVKDYELTLKRKDSKRLQVLITANAVKDKDGKCIFYRGVIHDITERRKLEQQLFQVQKMESIGTLAGGIAHDFNNILGGIMGYASLMKAKMSPDHPFFYHVETIERGTRRAAELTSKLLTFAMGGSYHIIPLSLNEIIQETIKMVSRLFDRSVEVKTFLDETLPIVEADPALMQQVVMNLLVNARDAMPKGGSILVETGVENITDDEARKNIEAKKGQYVVVSVTDSGVGIETEKIPRIFDPFFSTKEKGKGTGLGLAVVYGVVKNHGGFIKVYSEPGKGSIFRVYLPVSDKPLEKKTEPKSGFKLQGSECILIIEDEEDIRILTRDAFTEYGYRIILAADGEKACEIYEKKHAGIDLVILDMVMPKMGGQETLMKLKSINPDIKVILSSGYSQNGRAQEIINFGVAGFIQKPYQIQKLLTLVRQILDRKN